MEYLQYETSNIGDNNTADVLNLVINGIPSIPSLSLSGTIEDLSFKPCYKWNTFNTIFGKWNVCCGYTMF